MTNNILPIAGKNPLKTEINLSTLAELFATLKQLQFSGQLILTEPNGNRWTIDLYLGYVLDATGGIHPVKRWYRNLAIHLPDSTVDISTWQSELSEMTMAEQPCCWQYQLLRVWVEQGKVTREQATRIIWSNLIEVLFETAQTSNVTYELRQAKSSEGIVLIDSSRLVVEAQRQWLGWQKAQLTNWNPNKAPVIKQQEQLQQSTSATVFQMLSQLFDGKKTLRDVAVEMKRDLLTVTRSLLPYLQSELVELIDIPDLPAPILTVSTAVPTQKPLIACVDDSPLICDSLKKFLSTAGYRFVGINDPLKAFSVLLALKPDLIFLDLMMPNTNGYEVCDRLRRISFFRNTPIVILTGNDGVIDRVRAKMVGASDFLSKARVDAEMVQATLNKHLRHCTLSQLASGNCSSPEATKEVA
jgi:chemotaxis family two-component system response regulator PixG